MLTLSFPSIPPTPTSCPAVSLEQLDKERKAVRAKAAAIGDELEKLRAGEVPDKRQHVANLTQKLTRIRKDRDTAEQRVRPNFRKKAILDAIRITCRNVFRQPFDIFRPIYDNRRDDHEVLRQLSRSLCVIIRHRDRVDIYLTPALHRQPTQWKRIETILFFRNACPL